MVVQKEGKGWMNDINTVCAVSLARIFITQFSFVLSLYGFFPSLGTLRRGGGGGVAPGEEAREGREFR